MNEANPAAHQPPASREEMNSALFANMVLQQSNMALMFLGQVPHPQSGEHVRDLDAAKMFIDTLEMLEARTKGNLDKNEEGLLRRNLTALRMAFVEAVNQPPAPSAKQEPIGAASSAGAVAPGAPSSEGAAEPAASTAEAESRKKFSKKY